MKKVLALIVAFALCFTAFAGCIATSAAPVTGYAFDITAATNDLTSDGGDVVVTVSGKYTTIDTAQYLVVTLPENVTFKSVKNGVDGDTFDESTNLTDDDVLYKVAGQDIRFLEAYEHDVDFAIEITVNVPAYSEEATNEYVIEANAQVAAFDAATDEDITTIEDSVTITVPAPVPEHTCDFSGESYLDTSDKKWYKDCECGLRTETEAVVASAVTLTPGVRMGDTCLEISYALMGTAVNQYSDFYLEINRRTFANLDRNSTPLETLTITKSSATNFGNGAMYAFYCSDIAMFDLCVDVEAKLYLVKGDKVVAESVLYKNSVASLVKEYYAKTSDENTKRIYSDILNLAAAAQTHFSNGKPDSELANMTLANEGFTGSPSDDSVIAALVDASSTTPADAKITIQNFLGLSATPAIQYVFTGVTASAEDFRIDLSYNDAISGAVVTYSVNGTDTDKGVTYLTTGMYSLSYTGLALYDTDTVVTAKIYEGETLVATRTYSVDTYVKTNQSSAQGPLLKAIAKVGSSARTYFRNK